MDGRTSSDAPLLPFPGQTTQGRLIRREKRFLVHVQTPEGPLVAHSNNSGSMLGLTRPGARVLLSRSPNPNRKLAHTLELIEHHGVWVGVNTQTPNRLLAEAWRRGLVPELAGYETMRAEAQTGHSRLDFRFQGPAGELWVEAKNVTLVEDGLALFPDAVTERGRKHLEELMRLARFGARVAMLYLVQRADARCFGPADMIDQAYAERFHEALSAGVEAWPYLGVVTEQGVSLGRRLPLLPG